MQSSRKYSKIKEQNGTIDLKVLKQTQISMDAGNVLLLLLLCETQFLPCTGNVRPKTSMTGQFKKYSLNMVVSMVADMRIIRTSG